MTHLAIVSSDTLPTVDLLALDAVTGGFDFGAAIKSGNDTAPAGRQAGETLGQGFDAGYQAFTGKDSKIGSAVGGPLGAAAGWAGGFATNAYQQLTHKK
ncbi:MAG TPA: hypothetical protein VGC42_08655 [Kofleriaceae bacterium]